MKLLSLGDSYTIGTGVSPAERWPAQLCERMSDVWSTDSQITYVAQSGWTASELLSAAVETNLDTRYDYVTLLVGANDHYQHGSVKTYESTVQTLLELAIGLADNSPKQVLVLSIPDWTVTPFGQLNAGGTPSELDDFNAALWRESLALRVRYLDITPLSRLMDVAGAYVGQDGLHPSAPMYHLWADAAAKLLRSG